VFEIVFLGTAASAPSIQRGLSAQLVIYKEYRFLVDCGEGTQRQILRSGMGFRRLDRVLLTHGHLDHILGLAGLVSTFARWDANDHLEIWGGPRTLDRIEALLFGVGVVPRNLLAQGHIELFNVKPGTLMDDDEFRLSAFEIEHRGADSFGYCFEEKPRRPFLNDRAEALGVPRGPERRDLVAGKPVTLPNGTVITPDQVLGEVIPGTKLCITGDTSTTRGIPDAVQGADLLVTEATYLHHEVDLARHFGHITSREAAELARDSGVQNLVLTHLSRRYRERDVLAEAQEIFPDTIIARDFDHFHVKREVPLERAEVETKAED
jgi:ribonuclease Z